MNVALDPPIQLPALVTRAGQRLLNARNSAEVLEAKHLAESALHYAKLTQAANETHADCLRIITRAEIRMADEIDAGQATGAVAAQGRPSENRQGSAVYSDLGVDHRRVSEWREMRDAGPDVVEQAIQGALSDGRAPTKAEIVKHVRGTFGTGENEWFTPAKYVALARDVLGGIDLDPASHPIAQQTIQAAKFYAKADDGLMKPWIGRVWLNPPYAQPLIGQFVTKMVEERQAGRVTAAIMLTHNYTDTAWFHEAMTCANAVCFTRGRIAFVSPDGETAAPTQGQAFFYFGENVAEFYEAFDGIGFVVTPWR